MFAYFVTDVIFNCMRSNCGSLLPLLQEPKLFILTAMHTKHEGDS